MVLIMSNGWLLTVAMDTFGVCSIVTSFSAVKIGIIIIFADVSFTNFVVLIIVLCCAVPL